MASMFYFLRGFWQSLALFWGVALGTVIFSVLGLVDMSKVGPAPWFSTPGRLFGPWPEFNLGAMLSFALAYLAVLVNTAGSIFSIEPIVAADNMDKRFNRGVVWTGLSGILSGLGGVVGTVPYSLSPGVITVTRVGSRFAVTACGLFLIALAFLGKLNALLSAVPNAVVAAALMSSMAGRGGGQP